MTFTPRPATSTTGDSRAGSRPTRRLTAAGIDFHEVVGRPIGEIDLAAGAGLLTDRRVLVTGAGGSIGSELCRQIAAYAPRELILLDRDETGLQSTQVGISGDGLLTTPNLVLADIRDEPHIAEVFATKRPDVVFHAAALKHLPLLERYPEEAWKSNVLGTLAVLRAADAVGVERFVTISTDKAANPTSVLGASKRLSEQLTAAFAARTGRHFVSVRFGNVFGSRGSLIPLLVDLIESGRPVSLTHPDATRYFMSMAEAGQLVIEAAAIGDPGEILVLDMGEPVKILDVVQRVIELSGREVEIVITGLRPGEKVHEELMGVGETSQPSIHAKIAHTRVRPLEPHRLRYELLDETIRRATA